MGKVRWEYFKDEAYFGMYAVRPVGDGDFESPRLFHLVQEGDASNLVYILNKADMGVPNG